MFASYLCMFIVPAGPLRLPWLKFFRAFSSVVWQMPGYNPQRRPAPFQNFCVFLYIVCFVSFCVLFVCKCSLYYCHRVATPLHLTNISYLLQQCHNSKLVILQERLLKADSHIACRAHAVPLQCRALIHTRHAAPLPCSNSAVSFVKVRVIAGNIRTASPAV
jgi:hypothetical protein